MTIEARIELDSIGPSGVRLTTFVLKYPRFIHSEVMTHRVFSRNASSSRAIPVTKMIERIKEDPATPIHWGQNQPGMQAYKEHENVELGEQLWNEALMKVLDTVEVFNMHGFHKQIVNRLVEPWMHIHVVVTATDFANWFGLRHHHAAQPEIQELARQMWELYENNPPEKLRQGDLHLPFIDLKARDLAFKHTQETYPVEHHHNAWSNLLLKMSVARCARVSYLKHDGTDPTIEEDLKLYDRLLGAQPIHASPAEHQATAIGDPNVRSGNLRGWIQFRQTIEGHTIEEFTGPIGEDGE